MNAAMLAPETRDMMIGYAETIMARGSPVNTLEGLKNAMLGKWKLAFTTEERYRVLPPASRVFYNIRADGTMDNVVKVRACLRRYICRRVNDLRSGGIGHLAWISSAH